MIVIGDNQNAGIAYCEEMQVQGKMLKGKWSGPTPQAALTSNTLLDGGVNRLHCISKCQENLFFFLFTVFCY